MHTRALMLALVLVSTACSDDERPTTTGSEQPSDLAGPSPWGNSVADDDVDESQCGSPSSLGPTCAVNSDCGICHDGSNCGRAANREEIERLGAQCRIPDAAECEYAVVRCCHGRCRVTPS
jgi:hypothetical protein